MVSDFVARRASDGLQLTLRRLTSLAAGIAMMAFAIGAATFATGVWVFGSGSTGWFIVGGLLAFGPALAAIVATLRVRRTAHHAPQLLDEVHSFTGATGSSADVLLDYDSGQPVAMTAKNLSSLRSDLEQRSKDFPALTSAVKAITTVPKLIALAVPGTIAAGALGTVLLLVGLLS